MGNPAAPSDGGLCRLTFTHLAWAGDVSREWVAAAWQLPRGFGLIADAGLLRTPPLDSYDSEGRPTGSFQPVEWTAGAAVRIPLASAFSVGVGVRTFRLEDDTARLNGLGLSLGFHFNGASRRLGAAVTDLGPEASTGEAPVSLPTRWRAGVEQDFEDGRWTAALLIENGHAGSPRGSAGIVIRPIAGLELLGGVIQNAKGETDPLGHWSAGGRFTHGSIELGYSFVPGGNLEPTHHMGITFSMGVSGGQICRDARP